MAIRKDIFLTREAPWFLTSMMHNIRAKKIQLVLHSHTCIRPMVGKNEEITLLHCHWLLPVHATSFKISDDRPYSNTSRSISLAYCETMATPPQYSVLPEPRDRRTRSGILQRRSKVYNMYCSLEKHVQGRIRNYLIKNSPYVSAPASSAAFIQVTSAESQLQIQLGVKHAFNYMSVDHLSWVVDYIEEHKKKSAAESITQQVAGTQESSGIDDDTQKTNTLGNLVQTRHAPTSS